MDYITECATNSRNTETPPNTYIRSIRDNTHCDTIVIRLRYAEEMEEIG